MRRPRFRAFGALGLGAALAGTLLFAGAAHAQVFDERFDDWPLDLEIGGTIVVASSLADPAVLGDALRGERRRGDDDGSRSVACLFDAAEDDAFVSGFRIALDGADVHRADDPARAVAGLLGASGVVCWASTRSLTDAQRDVMLAARDAFAAHVKRGGVLIVVGPHAVSLARPGLGLLPDCVLDTEFVDAPGRRGALLNALETTPRSVGIGLTPNTALILRGRRMRVVGEGTATFLLAANEREPVREQTIAPRHTRRQPAHEYLVDLTGWRRDAIDRTLEPFPAASPRPPRVDRGTLVIVGGGRLPDGLMERWIDLAGGVNDARLVYVPCSERETVSPRQSTVESWKQMGVRHATFIHTKDRMKAHTDETFLAPLREATGIWFGGGRQWNFADSYYGTRAQELMKDVLRRGGVIGGSSAGASIQARYLARATPIGNTRIMAPGYERGGLGFLDGVAIDQHFSQRGRQADMTQLMERHPQLLGLGIDESTALVVRGSRGEVIGSGRVHVYDRRISMRPGRPDHLALPAGSIYDLAEREIIVERDTAGR